VQLKSDNLVGSPVIFIVTHRVDQTKISVLLTLFCIFIFMK
jgi:hypothetical protein